MIEAIVKDQLILTGEPYISNEIKCPSLIDLSKMYMDISEQANRLKFTGNITFKLTYFYLFILF